MKQKNKRTKFSGMLLDNLGASLLGNMLTGKGILGIGYGSKKF